MVLGKAVCLSPLLFGKYTEILAVRVRKTGSENEVMNILTYKQCSGDE